MSTMDIDTEQLPQHDFSSIPIDSKIASISWLKLDKIKFGLIARIVAYTTYDDNETCLYFRMHKSQGGEDQITEECGSISIYDLLSMQKTFPSTTYAHMSSTPLPEAINLTTHQSARITQMISLTPNLLVISLSSGAVALIHIKINVSTHGLDEHGELVNSEFIIARCVHFITIESHPSRSHITTMDSLYYSKPSPITATTTKPSQTAVAFVTVGTNAGIVYGIEWQLPHSLVNHLQFKQSANANEGQTDDVATLISGSTFTMYSFSPGDFLVHSTSPRLSDQNVLTSTQFSPISSIQIMPSYIAVSMHNSRYILCLSLAQISAYVSSQLQPSNTLLAPALMTPLIISPSTPTITTLLAFVPTNITFPYNQLHSDTMATQFLLSKVYTGQPQQNVPTSQSNLLFCFDSTTTSLHIFNPFDSLPSDQNHHTSQQPSSTKPSPLLPQLILPLLFSPYFQHHPTNTPDLDIFYSRPPINTPLHTFQPLYPISLSVYPGIRPIEQHLLNTESTTDKCTILLHTKQNVLYSIDLSPMLASNTLKYQQLPPHQRNMTLTQQHTQHLVRFIPIKQLYPALPHFSQDDDVMTQMTTGAAPKQQFSSHHQQHSIIASFGAMQQDNFYQNTAPLFINHPFVDPSLLPHFSTAQYAFDPFSTCTLIVQQDSIILCPKLQNQEERR